MEKAEMAIVVFAWALVCVYVCVCVRPITLSNSFFYLFITGTGKNYVTIILYKSLVNVILYVHLILFTVV